jgi:hypothetical protein
VQPAPPKLSHVQVLSLKQNKIRFYLSAIASSRFSHFSLSILCLSVFTPA